MRTLKVLLKEEKAEMFTILSGTFGSCMKRCGDAVPTGHSPEAKESRIQMVLLFLPLFFLLHPQPRPSANSWKKLEESREYKNGNTLREYQLEGVNWLLFNWYNR